MSVSGISKVLPFNAIQPVDEVKEIMNCGAAYILDSYEDDGFSLLLRISKEGTSFKFGSFSGDELDVTEDIKYKNHISDLLKNNIDKYIDLLKTVRVNQIQLYFAKYNDGIALVDARPFFNKYLGPGMLRDIISKCGIDVPKTIELVPLVTQEILDKYKGTNFVIKPATPKSIVRGDDVVPLSARIV